MTKLMTIDVWDTLLRRDCHPECIKLTTAQHVFLGWHIQIKPEYREAWKLYKARLEAERILAEKAKKDGKDDEYEITQVLSCWLDTIFINKAPTDLASRLAEFELNVEIARSYADPKILDFLNSHKAEQKIFLSDFYMGAESLNKLLASKNLDQLLSGGLSSCDIGFNKRSGKAFQHVHSLHSLDPKDHLHIGDNEWSDVQSARALGIEALHYLPESEHAKRKERERLFASRETLFEHITNECFSASKKANTEFNEKQQAAFQLGIRTAPLLIGFMLWIAEQAILEELDQLYFFTREGEFFHQVFQTIFPKQQYFGHPLPPSQILEVSRLSTFLPSLKDISIEEMLRIWSLSKKQSVQGLFVTLGINIEEFSQLLTSIDLNEADIIHNPASNPKIIQLFKTQEFIQAVKNAQENQKKLLLEYLAQKGIKTDCRYGVVDIGWRGTIQDNIALVMPQAHFHGLYLGLRPFINQQPENTSKTSFGPNENHSSKLSPLFSNYAAMEMLCNSPSGSVNNYAQVNGHSTPIRKVSEEENAAYSEFSSTFQQGVLLAAQGWQTYIERYAVSSADLHESAMQIWTDIHSKPENELVNIFLDSTQNELFCHGEFFKKNQFPTLSTIFLSPIVKSKRNEVIDFVRRVQWSAAIKNSKGLSPLHRSVLIVVFHTANLLKKVLFKWRLLKKKLFKSQP